MNAEMFYGGIRKIASTRVINGPEAMHVTREYLGFTPGNKDPSKKYTKPGFFSMQGQFTRGTVNDVIRSRRLGKPKSERLDYVTSKLSRRADYNVHPATQVAGFGATGALISGAGGKFTGKGALIGAGIGALAGAGNHKLWKGHQERAKNLITAGGKTEDTGYRRRLVSALIMKGLDFTASGGKIEPTPTMTAANSKGDRIII